MSRKTYSRPKSETPFSHPGESKEFLEDSQYPGNEQKILKERMKSSDHKEKNIDSITPEEIDIVIKKWYSAREDSKRIQKEEAKYKDLIMKVMDATDSNDIKGTYFTVSRKYQNRRFISKSLVPPEIFDKYSRPQEIAMFYIKGNRD